MGAAGSGASACIPNMKSSCRNLLLNETLPSCSPARTQGYLLNEECAPWYQPPGLAEQGAELGEPGACQKSFLAY